MFWFFLVGRLLFYLARVRRAGEQVEDEWQEVSWSLYRHDPNVALIAQRGFDQCHSQFDAREMYSIEQAPSEKVPMGVEKTETNPKPNFLPSLAMRSRVSRHR